MRFLIFGYGPWFFLYYVPADGVTMIRSWSGYLSKREISNTVRFQKLLHRLNTRKLRKTCKTVQGRHNKTQNSEYRSISLDSNLSSCVFGNPNRSMLFEQIVLTKYNLETKQLVREAFEMKRNLNNNTILNRNLDEYTPSSIMKMDLLQYN